MTIGSRLLLLLGFSAKPAADFTFSPLTIEASTSDVSQGIDASTGSPTSWLYESSPNGTNIWNQFSTLQNPQVTAGAGNFLTAGSFDIRLTATNAGGSNVKTRLAYLTVTNSG